MDPSNNNLTGNNSNPTPVPGGSPTPDPALGVANPALDATPVNAPGAPQEPLSGPVDLNSLGSQFGTETAPAASEEPTAPTAAPEPLVPTAPLPGSIGSVASGEPLPASPAEPLPAGPAPATPTPVEPILANPVAPATPAEPLPSAPVAPTPVDPNPAYNAPVPPAPNTAPATPPVPDILEAPSFAPADQPAQPNPFGPTQPAMDQPPSVSTAPLGPAPADDKPKSKMIIILLIVLAVLILGLGAFAAAQLLGNSNNEQASSTPAVVSEPEETILACSLEGDDDTLAGMGEQVTGFTQEYTINYLDDEFSDISSVSTITYTDNSTAADSIAALKESYDTYVSDALKLSKDPFRSNFLQDKEEKTKVIITHYATLEDLTAENSQFFNLNSTDEEGGFITDRADIKELYESMDLTCTSSGRVEVEE